MPNKPETTILSYSNNRTHYTANIPGRRFEDLRRVMVADMCAKRFRSPDTTILIIQSMPAHESSTFLLEGSKRLGGIAIASSNAHRLKRPDTTIFVMSPVYNRPNPIYP